MFPATTSQPASSRYRLAMLLLIALAYFACGKLGLALISPSTSVSLLWLPAGIAVAALLGLGKAYWPGVLLGAFATELLFVDSAPLALCIAATNTLAAWGTVWLLERWNFDRTLNNGRAPYLLIAATLLGMTISASGGSATLWAAGLLPSAEAPRTWFNWWLGDSVGVLLAVPLLQSLCRTCIEELRHKPLEPVLCLTLLTLIGWTIFMVDYGQDILPLAFLPLPLLILSSLRRGILGAFLPVLILSLLCAIGTSKGTGVFGHLPANIAMYVAWSYMFSLVLMALMIVTILGERKKTELRARQSELRYESLVRHAADALFVHDFDGNFVEVNQQACDSLGYTREELLRMNVADTSPNFNPAKGRALWSRLEPGKPHSITTIKSRKDGSTFPVEIRFALLELDGEKRVMTLVRDTTERLQAEQKLLDALHQLEEKELAKTRFLAAASHDLRQPLAAATLYVDTLKGSSPTPYQHELIGKLEKSMEVFSSQLARLLDISRFDAGIIKPEIAAIDLAELFDWVERNFANSARQKGLEFRRHVPKGMPPVLHTDIGLTESVLMNLVSNAIKFTERGGILIGARRRGKRMAIQVWDTGIGIGENDILRIFDEFFQVGNPQRNREAGLGLGLSIAKRAMGLLGGKITCRSRPGRGTVFELSLPLDRHGPTAPLPDTTPKPSGGISFDGKRIVLLEDDELVADALSRSLRNEGAETRHFFSAEEALRQDDIGEADIYIVDYSLGKGLTGLDFMIALQQRSPVLPCGILLTGETSSQLVARLAESSWPTLHKPATLAKITAALNKSGRCAS